MDKKRLPDAELAVMQAIWNEEGEVGRSTLQKSLEGHHWSVNTINTYLTRLCEKGFLSVRHEGRNNLYTPLISQKAYRQYDSREMLNKLYNGKLSHFVAALTAEKPLNPDDIQELQNYLDTMKRKAGDQ